MSKKLVKEILTQIGCGISFIVGTNLILLEGPLPFIGGVLLYALGYGLMDVYKNLK